MRLPFLGSIGSDSSNKKIFRAALIVGCASVFAKIGLAGRDLLVAHSFGRGDMVEAFLIAFMLPSFVMAMIMGAMGSALVPALVATRRREGLGPTEELLSSVFLISVVALTVTALLLGLLAPLYLPYVAHGFSPAKLRLTQELLYLLLPSVLFSGISMFVTSILNAGEKFALPAFVPILTPLVMVVFIVFRAQRWGAFSLAGGALAGSVTELALLLYFLRGQGIRLAMKWKGLNADLRGLLGQFAPMLAGSFLMTSTSVVNQSMAALLPAGSVAALNYGSRITNGVLAIGATALSTAALPYFSRMVAENDWSGCRHTLKRYSVLVVTTTLPFTFLLVAFSKPIIRLFFQRGAFTAADTGVVSWVQVCYALQVPFYIWGMLFVRFLSSVRRNDLLLYASAVNLALDIVLNLIFMRVWGVAGIALSTSVVYVISLLFVGASAVIFLAQDRSAKPGSVATQRAAP